MKTFASLFTGGGLADVGALQAGYELLWGVEIDPAIAAVASANLNHQVHVASVIGFDWGSLPRPDHLHMSPPCQDFSVAKRQGTVSNPNDEIADACIESLSVLQPQTVTLENVEGYKRSGGFQRIVDHLWGSGYWVNVDVLNAANFGVPQARRRLILRAVQAGIPGPLPQPVQWRGWYEAIEDLIPELPDSSFAPWQIKAMPRHHPLPDVFVVDDQYNGAPDKEGIRGLTIRSAGQPMFTVSATQSKRSVRARLLGRTVAFTREAFGRIQTLPDWYQGATARIIGNGVPCLMMQRILESL